MTKAAKEAPAPVERVKDETPVVTVEFSSAALKRLVQLLNDQESEDGSTVEVKDLAIGRVSVVTMNEVKAEVTEEESEESAGPDVSGTVDDVVARIATMGTVEQLDATKKAEKAGKARTGVLEAIDKRKAELKG